MHARSLGDLLVALLHIIPSHSTSRGFLLNSRQSRAALHEKRRGDESPGVPNWTGRLPVGCGPTEAHPLIAD